MIRMGQLEPHQSQDGLATGQPGPIITNFMQFLEAKIYQMTQVSTNSRLRGNEAQFWAEAHLGFEHVHCVWAAEAHCIRSGTRVSIQLSWQSKQDAMQRGHLLMYSLRNQVLYRWQFL